MGILFWIVWVGPKYNHLYLYEEIFNSHRRTGSHVTREAEIGPMWPQAWECNSHQKLEEARTNSPSSLQRLWPADTLMLVQ